MIYFSEQEEQTAMIAAALAKRLQPGAIVLLDGAMGAGKSVFARGVLRGLGYEGVAASPTFTLMNQYEAQLPVYHFDLYRLDREEQLYDIGYEEFLYGDGLSLIEWAQRMGSLLPREYVRVALEKTGVTGRQITVEDNSGWMLAQ